MESYSEDFEEKFSRSAHGRKFNSFKTPKNKDKVNRKEAKREKSVREKKNRSTKYFQEEYSTVSLEGTPVEDTLADQELYYSEEIKEHKEMLSEIRAEKAADRHFDRMESRK
jgi:hypothetical protein